MPALNFNAKDHQPLGNIEAVPTGWYPVKITKSELKDNSAKTGRLLELTGTITSGDHAGGMLITRLNIENPNTTAVEIAQRSLSSICHAVKVYQLTKTEQLHNIVHEWKAVYVEPVIDDDGKQIYAAKNDIKGYREATTSTDNTNDDSTPFDNDEPDWVTEDTTPETTPEPAPAPAPTPEPTPEQEPKPKPKAKAKAKAKAKPAKKSKYDKYMTDKAGGIGYNAFIDKGWSKDSMIKNGYMDDPGDGEAPEIPDVPPPADAPAPEDAPSTPSKPPWVPD